ncbi:MAG: hypothetical protein QOC68_4596, partial [Solirubrobacteraceae bacterium]|nr:hypothetical protein [Solirubrobacteraceae bacterium]
MTLVSRALVVALLALGAAPAGSSAGTYDVYSCSLPNGEPAPTEGWSAETRGSDANAYNGCGEFVITRGSLNASFAPYAASGDYAGWVFSAPSDVTIGSYTIWRWVRTASRNGGFQDYYLSHDLPFSLDPRYLSEFCSRYASCSERGAPNGNHLVAANRVARSGLQIKRLNAFLQCRLAGATRCDSTEEAGRLSIFAARFGFSDLMAPVLRARPSGSLLQATAPLEGETTISFAASDRGGGIEKVGVVIDGQPRLERAADPNAARCHRPFTALKPCPAASDNTLVFDTATLPNGAHTVQASVTDAAGNETRSDPVTVTTRNGSRPNGR